MLKFEKAGEFEDVIYERSGYVARITLNKPDTMNTGVKDVGKAMALVEEADDIKVLIIKGAGRALAAGAPLNEVGFVYGWKEPKHGEKAPKTPIRNRLKFDRSVFYEGALKDADFPENHHRPGARLPARRFHGHVPRVRLHRRRRGLQVR